VAISPANPLFFRQPLIDTSGRTTQRKSKISELERKMTRLLEEGKMNRKDYEELAARFAKRFLAIMQLAEEKLVRKLPRSAA